MTEPSGLTTKEAEERLNKFGENILELKKKSIPSITKNSSNQDFYFVTESSKNLGTIQSIVKDGNFLRNFLNRDLSAFRVSSSVR